MEEAVKFLLTKEKERRVLEALSIGQKSFTELRDEAGLKYNEELSRALKNLQRYVLYDHVYKKKKDQAFSYYELNSLGKETLRITHEVEAHIRKQKKKIPA